MLKNPLLQKTQDEIDKTVTDRASFDKIVRAATKTIYDKDVFDRISQGIAQSQDPVSDVAKGIVGIIGALASRAQGTMPHDVAVQAGMSLMLDALDFLEQAGLVQVDNAMLEKALNDFIEAMLPNTGLTAEKLGSALQQLAPVLGNEEQMAKFEASMKGGA